MIQIKPITRSEYGTREFAYRFTTAGYYDMGVECKGNNKAEWKITTDEGEIVRDMLVPTNAYDWHRMGWLHFQKPGTHTITLQPLDGDYAGMSLSGLKMMHLDIEVEE